MLSQYVAETQDLLNDQQAQLFRVPTVVNYVNRARRRIAAISGCLRCIPPGTQTIGGQEIYPFSDWQALVQTAMVGSVSILACRSLAVSIGGKWQGDKIVGGSWRPLWRRLPYTDFAARFRIYGGTFIGQYSDAGWYSQFGLGPAGKLYLAPIPTMRYPLEVDLTLIPQRLLNDNDPEPMPYPWTDCVCYLAAMFCYLQNQRPQDAAAMTQLFNSLMPEAAAVVGPTMMINPYATGIQRSA